VLYSLTTKYCAIALTHLATQPPAEDVQVREIARATQIPAAFLARLVPTLVKAGLVRSRRGVGGGIRLARSPTEIALADVVRATEGERFFENCLLTVDPCDGTQGCPLHSVWGPTRDRIVTFLETTTIADLARKSRPQRGKEARARPARRGVAPKRQAHKEAR
jgi:Rrf2 family protein